MDTDYWHSLDRQAAKDLNVDYLAVSTHPFKEQLDELKAKIFSGTKAVELSFIATGTGSRAQGQIVPEHYGKEEREELRQLAKINDLDLSVHSPTNAPPLSGFSQKGFSNEVKQESLKELKRTIEFAADVARGGPITVHAQEFTRPIFEAGEKFEGYKGEREKAPLYFVDVRTGQIQALDRALDVPIPKGGFDNPFRDPKTGFVKEWEKKKIYDFEQEALQKKEEPIKYILNNYYKKDFEFKEIEAREYASQAKKLEQEDEFLKGIIKNLKEQSKTNPENANYNTIIWMEKFEAERRERLTPREGTKEYNDFLESPLKYLEELQQRTEKSKLASFEAADTRKLEIEERKKMVENFESLNGYALKQTADSIANAAIYAYQKEKAMKLEKPLIISPENVYTQAYGSSPKELKSIIEESRKDMADKLINEKMAKSREEAEKIAEERIKATFDIGHLNLWRQYFKGSDEEFKNWILNETTELTKKGIIGHVHVSDNFGYEDVHLTPGQGSVPIKEFVDKITKEGFKGKMVLEAGGQRAGEGWPVLPGAWKTLGSPIYRIDSKYGTWTDIEGSYFGKTGSPNYLVGDIVPSKEWILWSETQLE